MKKPIVFINTDALTFDDPVAFEPGCVASLIEVLKATGADVWLTSDWAQQISLDDVLATLSEDGADEIATRLMGVKRVDQITSADAPYAIVDIKQTFDDANSVIADDGFWEGEALRLTAILVDAERTCHVAE